MAHAAFGRFSNAKIVWILTVNEFLGSNKEVENVVLSQKSTIDQLSCKDINTVIQTVQNGETKPWANVQILVIDDLEFAHTDGLQREYGFNIRWMKDITPDQTKDFDIVLCDQEGEGRMLSKNNQGGSLAREFRSRFPMKYVVLYTASGKAIGNSDILKVVDNAISPGADLDDFAQILKEWCAEVMNPKKRWIKLRQRGVDSCCRPNG